MERRRFTREFKVEAVKLVRERGVADGAVQHRP
jgi:transposase-like protein